MIHFKPISIKEFVETQVEKNPTVDAQDLTKRLEDALNDYENEQLCSCGNDIWVVGSAFAGNACFTCITGESETSDNYEIESALFKRFTPDGRRHIDMIPPMEISGVFDDDGYEVLIKEVPLLCTTCQKHIDQEEFAYMLCKLMQSGVKDGEDFVCRDYRRG